MAKPNIRPITLCDTTNMTEEEWLIMRTGKYSHIPCTIGGSEAASVFDLNPWVTSKELYDKKSHIIPAIKKEFNSENKEMGHIFERYVQDMFILWFKKAYGIELKIAYSIEEFNSLNNAIYNDKHFYQCGEIDEKGNLKYPFAVANIDGLIKLHGRIGVLEYKTTTIKGKKSKSIQNDWRKGKAPIYYEYQTRHYMGVLNLDFAFIICAWAFALDEMGVCHLERDYALENDIFEGEKKFVNAVLQKTSWNTNLCDVTNLAQYYTLLYGATDDTKETIVLNEAYFPILERLVERQNQRDEINATINKMDKEDDELACILAPIMKGASKAYCQKNSSSIIVSIDTPKSKHITHTIEDNGLCKSAGLDYERLKKEQPDVWDEYQTQVFDVKRFKQQRIALFSKYQLPDTPTGDKNKLSVRMQTL